ncbi:MAG: GPR1/FUN34/YaaH family transporter [Azoarcus sp.]|jgi:succinate-acetate transporter protein|nr:GPR1/FUN34/YaaH family transporter [Azoarcus sp.]
MSEVQETKIVSADATALGVFGLSLITFVASSQKLGWTVGSVYLIPWSMFLGSIAQLWAAAIDYKRNSYFGAIVLGAFGLFWMAVAMIWGIQNGWFGEVAKATADLRQFGYACFGFLIFCVFITITAFEANKVFGAIMVLILVLLSTLGVQLLLIGAPTEGPAAVIVDDATKACAKTLGTIAGWSEFAISILGFYAAGAIFLNTFFGRTILPLGKPMGWIKKGA